MCIAHARLLLHAATAAAAAAAAASHPCIAAMWQRCGGHGALSRVVREKVASTYHTRTTTLNAFASPAEHLSSPRRTAVLGVHMKFDDVRVNDKVSQWNVRVLEVSLRQLAATECVPFSLGVVPVPPARNSQNTAQLLFPHPPPLSGDRSISW